MASKPTVQPKKILVVEDEDTLRDILKKSIEKEGYEVATASDGKSAQSLVTMEDFDAVISDIHMPNSTVSGIELLHFIKKQKDIPVILMTGFAELAETKEAFNLGASGFLAKPFKKDDLIKAIKSVVKTDEPLLSVATDSDAAYCKLSIDDFITGRHIKYNIFVRLAEDRYVKIAHEGADLSVERIRSYKEKSIRYLYLTCEDFRKYLELSLNITQAARMSSAIDAKKKLHLVKHAGDVMLECFFNNEIDSTMYDSAKAMVESSLSILTEQKEIFDLVEVLNRHSDHLYAHSLGVSLYATLIAKQLKWNSPQTLFKISMVGLMHDIGQKEIDRTIIKKSRTQLSAEEIKIFESHPARGVKILSNIASFPTELLQVVQQHHENCAGTGYPGNLIKTKIQPLARLIAVCDEFCELIIDTPHRAKLTPHEAMARMVTLYKDTLDVDFIVPLAQILRFNLSAATKGARKFKAA